MLGALVRKFGGEIIGIRAPVDHLDFVPTAFGGAAWRESSTETKLAGS